MKRIYLLCIGAAISTLLLTQCNDPLENMELQVSTNVINYSTMLQIEDGNGNPVTDATVRISGADANSIYNLAGKKEFAATTGLLGLGIHPKAEPTLGNPVTFTVELSAPGYLTQIIPVTITEQDLQGVKLVNMLNIADAPEGVAIEQTTVTLTNNATVATQTISTVAENQNPQTIDITINSGTQFQTASGTVITGSSLVSTVAYLDPAKEASLAVFPSGSLTSNNIITQAGGSQAVSGSFNPAAVVSIDFFLGNTEVKRFSQPITLTMELDPTFTNITTGSTLQVGDQLGIYSYDVSTAQWRFEKNVTVTLVGGKPVAQFTTDHLTWYMVGNFVSSCNTPVTLNLASSWMQAGTTYPLKLEAILAGKVISTTQVSASSTNALVSIVNLPLSASGVSIRVSTMNGQVLTGPNGQTLPVNTCTATHPITLSQPAILPTVTMQLYVRCPGNDNVMNILPTFYLYYRDAASASNTSGYKLLGVVNNGFISTTLLTANTTQYDFKAVWGEHTKYAMNRTVQADNSATVGTQPGDILGGQNNLNLLIQNCPQ